MVRSMAELQTVDPEMSAECEASDVHWEKDMELRVQPGKPVCYRVRWRLRQRSRHEDKWMTLRHSGVIMCLLI